MSGATGADERAIRVFVSSTFRDMQLERDELVKRVFPQIRRLCERRGVAWSEVDLRWGVTDEQQAEGAVLPICLAEIDRTRPYFIGLIGQRYGWVPDEIGADLRSRLGWLADDAGRSVTELEILHGVLNHAGEAGHAFFYLRDPAWVDALPAEQRATYVEHSPAGAERLAALRDRITASGHPTVVYPDPVALGERVLADLTQLVDTLYPETSAPTDRTHVDAVHAAFGRARFGVFVDRPQLTDRLDRHALDGAAPLLVTGAPGCGASALVTRWARHQHADVVLVHHVDAGADAADHRALAERICDALGLGGAELDGADHAAVRSALRRAFRAFAGRAIVVLDGVDRLDDVDGAPDLRWFPADVPAGVRVVVTANGARARDAATHRGWPVLEVPPLDEHERRSIAAAVLAEGAKALDPANMDALVAAAGTSNARFLVTVVDELRQHGEHFTLRALIDRLAGAASLDDLLDMVLERYEHDFERDRPGLTHDVVTAVWAARRGVAESELLALLAPPGLDQLPAAVWAPLHLAAERGLVSRGGLFGFADAALRRAVERRYLPDDASRRAAHARLARFFGARPLSGRVTDELGWQLAEAGDLDGLRAVLADLDHVELAYTRHPGDVRRLWARLAGTGDELVPAMTAAYRAVLADPAAFESPAPDAPGAPRQLVWGLARLLGDAGAPAAALALHRVLVDAARRVPAGRGDRPGGEARLRAALVNLGAAEWSRGGLVEAERALTEAVDRCRAAGDDRMLASALGNLAMVRRDLGRRAEADALFAEEERLCRALDDEYGLQAGLANHAQLLREVGRHDDALAMLREQEQICRDLADPVAVARALAGQAAVLADRGDVAGAIALTEQHAAIARAEGDVRGLTEALLNLGVNRLQLGDVPGSTGAITEAEALARRLDDPDLIARVLVTHASTLAALARWPEAERVAREAELTARGAGLPRSVAAALNVVGTARREQGDATGARVAHEAELEAATAGGDELAAAVAQTNLGNVAAALGRYAEAIERYGAAEPALRRLDVPGSLLPLLANRGQIHQASGRAAEALADLADAALAAARSGQTGVVRQWAEPALGLAYQTGDVDRAEWLWALLADAARATNDDALLQRSLGDGALLLVRRAQPHGVAGDPTNVDQALLDRAAAMLDEQEAICRRIGDDVGLAACVGNRAIVLRYRGDLAGSLGCLDEQLRVASRSADAHGVLIATANRGEVLALLGRRAEAMDALQRARSTAAQHGLAPMVHQLDAMIAGLQGR